MNLTQKKCVACDAKTPRLEGPDIALLIPEVPGWQVVEGNRKLTRRFTHDDFKHAMAFVNRLADLAESEGHHPDFSVQYNKVDVSLWTHAIGGLSENDFILAAKLNEQQ